MNCNTNAILLCGGGKFCEAFIVNSVTLRSGCFGYNAETAIDFSKVSETDRKAITGNVLEVTYTSSSSGSLQIKSFPGGGISRMEEGEGILLSGSDETSQWWQSTISYYARIKLQAADGRESEWSEFTKCDAPAWVAPCY